MKKFVGVLCLAGALVLFFYAKKTTAADQAQTEILIRRMAEAQQRESAISSLKTKILLENFDVTDKEVHHIDPGAEKAELAQNRKDLGQLQQIEQKLGSASMQESALKDLQNHHWMILAEYVGAGLLALVGLGLLL